MTTGSIWVRTDYPDGEFIDISKAFTLRVVKDIDAKTQKTYWNVNAELPVLEAEGLVERTIKGFTDEQAAKDLLESLMKLFPLTFVFKK